MIHKNLNFIIESTNGKNVVYLHGWQGNAHSLDVLKCKDIYTVMSLDFFSFCEEEDYDTYESALDVYLELLSRGITNINIVAHSYGGRVAMILASAFEINVESVVLISSAGINLFDIKTKLKLLNYKLVKLCVKLHIFSSQVLSKFGSQDYKVLSNNMKKVFSNIVRQDLRHLLPHISDKTNVVLIYGSSDFVTKKSIMKHIKSKLKNVKCYLIKGGDHFCYLTHSDYIKNIIKNNI